VAIKPSRRIRGSRPRETGRGRESDKDPVEFLREEGHGDPFPRSSRHYDPRVADKKGERTISTPSQLVSRSAITSITLREPASDGASTAKPITAIAPIPMSVLSIIVSPLTEFSWRKKKGNQPQPGDSPLPLPLADYLLCSRMIPEPHLANNTVNPSKNILELL
jgi:hypothetical protein